MKREEMLKLAQERSQPWDMIIVGGGATGAGVAVDAATRGYATPLLEQHDFGKGTSSRSTKLVHGGVRYLEHLHAGQSYNHSEKLCGRDKRRPIPATPWGLCRFRE